MQLVERQYHGYWESFTVQRPFLQHSEKRDVALALIHSVIVM